MAKVVTGSLFLIDEYSTTKPNCVCWFLRLKSNSREMYAFQIETVQ